MDEKNELSADAIKVGHDGFIRLVDVTGSDASIVQAARISYGAGTKTPSDDRALIRYLMRHKHTTPFEMVEAKFHVRVAMDTWRQWVRHRTASINEYSTRYSEAIDAAEVIAPDEWRLQSLSNKQGSSGGLDPAVGAKLTELQANLHKTSREIYETRLEFGVAREQARRDLPLSTYTEAYWKCDLHNIFNFLRLRLDTHAQLEIRQYAQAMYKLLQDKFPLACEAFEDFVLNAVTFSAQDLDVLSIIVKQSQTVVDDIGTGFWPTKREHEEFVAKLKKLVSM